MPSIPQAPLQAEELAPAAGSVTRRIAADARILATAGYALIMQVSHPTVGAGVHEHSNFESDPWGRLLRTLDYTTVMVYGRPGEAAAMGRRILEMHGHIRGLMPDGRRYSALEPEAYAWVHATLAEAIVNGTRRFAGGMSDDEVERFYGEWRNIGRLIGVEPGELPGTWPGFRAYFDRMVETRLGDNEAVRSVLAALRRPVRPAVPMLNELTWRAARLPIGRLLSLATVGLLPAPLRRRLGVSWSRASAAELAALSLAARSATPLMPASLRCFGPAYLDWRAEAIGIPAAA